MKIIIEILIMFFLLTALLCPQENNYWNAATGEGSKIYSIYFFDKQNGLAISANKEHFITVDGGTSWRYIENAAEILDQDTAQNNWRTDIYCSVMNTIDGGKNWTPYTKEQQDHFCKVYLKDPNVDYKTASEFLGTVTKDIFNNILINKIDVLVEHPKQCTEYYSSESEGWALGWCLKNFKISKN
ncbi:MAG: hypothetical protein MUF28_13720 [Ignavibacterium sp.]|jgi:hypothetical protein|nr:hypothetical protein [Ignavibacterium sp.]